MGGGAANAYSVELCGGTHVRALGDIGVFKIVSEGAVSSGVRRIEALTGEGARHYLNARDAMVKSVAAALKTSPDDVPARVAQLIEERKRLDKELAEAKKALALGGGGSGSSGGGVAQEAIGDVAFMGQVLHGVDPKALRSVLDDMKSKLGSGIAVLVAVNDGRGAIAAAVTDDLTTRYDAVALVRAGVEALGGKGGGGRADMAQGGGPDGDKADAALAAVRAVIAG